MDAIKTELDAAGRITQWREAYDLASMMDQIKAAGLQADRPAGDG